MGRDPRAPLVPVAVKRSSMQRDPKGRRYRHCHVEPGVELVLPVRRRDGRVADRQVIVA